MREHLIQKPLLTGIRSIALFEAAKGAMVLFAGFGLLALIHHDVQALAERILRHSHLNLAGRYPRIFLDLANRVTDARLWLFASIALSYACVRAVEAYGLWYERRWAEWFALVSGAAYVPIEIYELLRGFSWLKACILTINLGVVVYMAYALRHAADQRRELKIH